MDSISEHVSLFGFVENPYAEMKRADLFVLSSDCEGSPTVLTECLSMGIPCVATDVGDVAQTLQNGRVGRVVPCNDTQALAEAMQAESRLAEAVRAAGARLSACNAESAQWAERRQGAAARVDQMKERLTAAEEEQQALAARPDELATQRHEIGDRLVHVLGCALVEGLRQPHLSQPHRLWRGQRASGDRLRLGGLIDRRDRRLASGAPGLAQYRARHAPLVSPEALFCKTERWPRRCYQNGS